MKTARRRTGDLGESIACDYLVRRGFEILERNHLRPWGEIDVVATKEGVYHFVEVKTISRENSRTGMSAEDHVHPEKLRRLSRTVELYMGEMKGDSDYQIDVLAISLDFRTRKAKCTLYEQVL